MVTVAEIEAELERDDKQKKSDDGVATVKHLDRTYMGMLEYKKEDEAQLIKCLILGEWKTFKCLIMDECKTHQVFNMGKYSWQ